jgi:hypothetical protein
LAAAALLGSLVLGACGVSGGVTVPATSTSAAPSPATPSPTASSTTPSVTTAPPHGFSQEAIGYFVEIAFGAEYGGTPEIVKWTTNVRIAVHGDPTDSDTLALKDVVSDLNALIDPIEISIVTTGQNVDLYFYPEEQFSQIEPAYVPVNMGFFWTWPDDTGSITEAHILISTTRVTQEERNHLIREELTQALGLMRDSYTYDDSIFYQGWTATQDYSDLDRSLIEMLYLPEVTPGMDVGEALAVIPRS